MPTSSPAWVSLSSSGTSACCRIVGVGRCRRRSGRRARRRPRRGRSGSRAWCRACRRRRVAGDAEDRVVALRVAGDGEDVAVVGGDDDQRLLRIDLVVGGLHRVRRARRCPRARGRRCRRGGAWSMRPASTISTKPLSFCDRMSIAFAVISASDGSPPGPSSRSVSYCMWLGSKSPSRWPVAAGSTASKPRLVPDVGGVVVLAPATRRRGRGRRRARRSCRRPPGRPGRPWHEVRPAAAEDHLEAVAGRPVDELRGDVLAAAGPGLVAEVGVALPVALRGLGVGRGRGGVGDARGRDDAGGVARGLGALEDRGDLVALLAGADVVARPSWVTPMRAVVRLDARDHRGRGRGAVGDLGVVGVGLGQRDVRQQRLEGEAVALAVAALLLALEDARGGDASGSTCRRRRRG